jgi:hypothetical protein
MLRFNARAEIESLIYNFYEIRAKFTICLSQFSMECRLCGLVALCVFVSHNCCHASCQYVFWPCSHPVNIMETQAVNTVTDLNIPPSIQHGMLPNVV